MGNDTTLSGSDRGVASGRFVLRIDPRLHSALRQAAQDAGVSLNELCARKLALPSEGLVSPGGEATARLAAWFGDSLVGVVVFGSWARDELAQESDVDLLVVLDETVAIDRGLYRKWDEAPILWNSHSVEPHFVHMPKAEAPLSGTWAEVAVEGVVLFECDQLISRLFVAIRQKIAAGKFVRRQIHGQAYWVEAP